MLAFLSSSLSIKHNNGMTLFISVRGTSNKAALRKSSDRFCYLFWPWNCAEWRADGDTVYAMNTTQILMHNLWEQLFLARKRGIQKRKLWRVARRRQLLLAVLVLSILSAYGYILLIVGYSQIFCCNLSRPFPIISEHSHVTHS